MLEIFLNLLKLRLNKRYKSKSLNNNGLIKVQIKKLKIMFQAKITFHNKISNSQDLSITIASNTFLNSSLHHTIKKLLIINKNLNQVKSIPNKLISESNKYKNKWQKFKMNWKIIITLIMLKKIKRKSKLKL